MSERKTLAGWTTWLAAGLVLAGLIAALVLWGQPLYDLLADQARMRAWVDGFGPWGPAAIVVLEMAQVLLAPIPGQAIEAVSGYLYGPWLGALYAMIGIVIGSLFNFALARRFGRPLATRLAGADAVARFDDLARRRGAPFFFLLWLLPLVPDDLACLAAGLTPMPLRQFLVLMTLGRLPGILVATLLGANTVNMHPTGWGVLVVGLALAAAAFWRWGNKVQAVMFHFIQRLAGRLERG